MSDSPSTHPTLRNEIYRELASIRLIDPHTHIDPLRPASSTLADILGYHYYTELAHSSGMEKARIEQTGLRPRELVGRLVEGLGPLENTAQYHWLIEICRKFFGFEGDRLHAGNWESLYDTSESTMASAQWAQSVLDQSNVAAVFLTNDFDDALEGFDARTYIPCLRTDDLVFHLADPKVRDRLLGCTGIELDGSLTSLRDSLQHRFDHFVRGGARACAISLPPSFSPQSVSDGRAQTALEAVLRDGLSVDAAHRDAIARRVFWTLAELCDQYRLPFDLMIGVNRGVYPGGVHQGRDLFDSRVSLIQYRDLFNAFPNVRFPVSVLASVTNQELVSYAWIFPNVITSGHWWYSNTPSTIARDAALRLEAVPQTKQIGYYSDAYKLEFVWPKFDMYRQVLAGVLADQFVTGRGWAVERAVDLGHRVLRENVETIFPAPPEPSVFEPTRAVTDERSGDDGHAATMESLPQFSPALASIPLAAAAAETFNDADPVESNIDDGLGLTDFLETGSEANATVMEDFELPTVIDSKADQPTFTSPDLQSMLTIDEEPDEEPDESDWPTNQASDDDDAFSDLPTVMEDPLPRDEEMQELDLMDVELLDAPEKGSMELDPIDPEFLDVGDLLGESGDEVENVAEIDFNSDETMEKPTITQMTGDGSFSPDEETFQMEHDPETGEYTFPISGDDEDDEFDFLTLEDDDKN